MPFSPEFFYQYAPSVMIKFKPLRTSDKDIIQSFTLCGKKQYSDLSFTSLICWRFCFNTRWAVINDFLIFRFYHKQHLAYTLPIPRPSSTLQDEALCKDKANPKLMEAVEAIRQDANALGHPLLIIGVEQPAIELIEKAFPDAFEVLPNRDYADYVYERDKLSTLSGKKLQSKRNHVNKFERLYPNYEYRPLTLDLIPECIRLEQEWQQESRADTTETYEVNKEDELRAMTKAFNHWEQLDLVGGTLWVDNKMIAFTYGCAINQNTFDVCVEKADTNYEGAYNVINREFVRHLPPQFVYINREEDLGEPGLRQSKLSYHPAFLLEKNIMREKLSPACFPSRERVLTETKQLWKEVFGDSDAFINLYFSRVYKPLYNVTCVLNNHVVGALQTLPYTLSYFGNHVPASYISGVCVSPSHQHEGIGNNLMEQAHFSLYRAQTVFAVLIPANSTVEEWYANMGYAPLISCEAPDDNVTDLSFDGFNARQKAKDVVLLHTAESFAVAQEDIRISQSNQTPLPERAHGMLRVVNAKRALDLYAQRFPNERKVIQVYGDEHIHYNNAYYLLRDGEVEQTHRPQPNTFRLSIAELAELIFANTQAQMTLMLN